ncbi:hypothetical protein HB773_04575 [Sinorhizobium meliloti]|nr:hypothetical protein HB773_04575 [Sinorhizobium meliloti]
MTTNAFLPLTAPLSDAEMLTALKNPEAAMGFGLEHLEPFEMYDFIRDWKEGKDLTPWLEAWRRSQKAAGEGRP